MQDRMSTLKNNKPMKEFIEYLHTLIEGIVLKGESFDKNKKWLKKYCDESGIDYNYVKTEIHDFIELLGDDDVINDDRLKKMLHKVALNLHLTKEQANGLLIQSQAKEKQDVSMHNATNLKPKKLKAQEEVQRISSNSKRNKIILTFLAISTIGLLVSTIVFYFNLESFREKYYHEKKQNNNLRDKVVEKENKITEKKDKITELETFIYDFGEKNPIEITNIKFANKNSGQILNDYGSSLYSNSMRYLYGKVYFNSYLKTGKTIKVYLKIFKSDGTLKTGSSSSGGYSTSTKIYISGNYSENQVNELSGWGNKSTSTYDSGYYRYEIWYNNKCIGYKKIYIY